jgi:ABC-type multidrug transport system fused ATPase/permease subunit
MQSGSLIEEYLKAAGDFRVMADREERVLFILSMLRLICFAGGILLIWWFGFGSGTGAALFISVPVIAVFIWLLKLCSSHTGKKEFLNNLSDINTREAAALSGDLSSFATGMEFNDPDHPFSNDVDLFGESSLFHYINRSVTSYGREILAGWLSDPYPLSADIARRQEVIKELAGKESWRHEFMASACKNPLEEKEIATLLKWLNEKNDPAISLLHKYLIFVLPVAALVSLALLAAGVLHYSIFTFIFLVNLFYVFTGLKSTNRIHNALSRKYNYLSSMNSLLKAFEREHFNAELMKDIRTNISGKGVSAAASVKKLGRLIQDFDNRLNLLVGLVLNGLLLWDYHSIRRLDSWKREYSDHFPVWLGMLGQVDAFISLANYACNNPLYSYPAISTDETLLSAVRIGHPLINDKDRVCNDFSLKKRGIVCVITGANMAGKSTFLRTIAVNYILGMTGAPVCAGEMRFLPVKLFTSMRTTDSLSGHESYFYAELKRLRLLKSLIENREPVLFILDEILKGTNSADKSLGSKLFIKRLIAYGGTGLIATHDISVGEMESDYPGIIINRCFEVEIDGEAISFDYLLRSGITHKMNAALLMKQMGILD